MDCTDNTELLWALLIVAWSVINALIKAFKKGGDDKQAPPAPVPTDSRPSPSREPSQRRAAAPVPLDSFLETVFEDLGIPVEKDSAPPQEPWGPHDPLWHAQEEGDSNLEHHGDRWGEHGASVEGEPSSSSLGEQETAGQWQRWHSKTPPAPHRLGPGIGMEPAPLQQVEGGLFRDAIIMQALFQARRR